MLFRLYNAAYRSTTIMGNSYVTACYSNSYALFHLYNFALRRFKRSLSHLARLDTPSRSGVPIGPDLLLGLIRLGLPLSISLGGVLSILHDQVSRLLVGSLEEAV